MGNMMIHLYIRGVHPIFLTKTSAWNWMMFFCRVSKISDAHLLDRCKVEAHPHSLTDVDCSLLWQMPTQCTLNPWVVSSFCMPAPTWDDGCWGSWWLGGSRTSSRTGGQDGSGWLENGLVVPWIPRVAGIAVIHKAMMFKKPRTRVLLL